MTNFTHEQLQSIYEMAKEIKGGQPQDITSDEYLQTVLMDRIGNMSQTEAADITTRMEKTINDFNLSYNRGIESGSVPAEDTLKEAIRANGMSDVDAANYLASTIVLIRNYGTDVTTLTNEELKAQAKNVIGAREINDETVQCLIKEAADAIRSSNVMSIDDKTAGLIAASPFDANLVSTIREQARSPLYLSVAAYILGIKGELQLPENETSPESIALGVATGMKIQEISADLSEGKIDLPTWTKYVKIAAGCVLALSAAMLALPILAALSVNVLMGCLLIFGSFTASVWVTGLIVTSVLIYTGMKVYENANKLMDYFSNMFDKACRWVMDLNVSEAVSKCYTNAVKRIAEYIQKLKNMAGTLRSEKNTADTKAAPTVVETEVISEDTNPIILN